MEPAEVQGGSGGWVLEVPKEGFGGPRVEEGPLGWGLRSPSLRGNVTALGVPIGSISGVFRDNFQGSQVWEAPREGF